MRNFFRYFVQGLILIIPLIITLAVLIKVFDYFTQVFSFASFTESIILNTLLGLICTLIFISWIGLLASSFVFKRIFSYFEDKMEHAPFIRHIYSPIRDFTNAFVGNKKRFNKPVLVLTNPLAHIYEIGFLTQEDLSDFGIRDKVAVYLPLSYSLSGKLIIVPLENIKLLDADAADTMKFVVSGGVTDVEH